MAITGGGIASSVGDLFGAIGDFKEASAYGTAAKYAKINAGIAAEEGSIRSAQTQRQIFQVRGAQQAGYAGAGLATSGSAIDVMRNTVQQGALQKAILAEQTQINVSGYLEQEAQFKGMQGAANAAGTGGIVKGIFDFLGF